MYTFSSGPNDPMLTINPAHAYLIRRLYTSLREDGKVFMSSGDVTLLEQAADERLPADTLSLVEQLNVSMVADIVRKPSDWAVWLQLFDDENVYEETVPNEDRPDTSANLQTVREISSIQKLQAQADFFDPSSAMEAKPWRKCLSPVHTITEHADDQVSIRDRMQFEVPNTYDSSSDEEDPKETIRRQMLLECNRELDRETDVNLATQRDDLATLEAMPEFTTPRTARRPPRQADMEEATKQSSRTAR